MLLMAHISALLSLNKEYSLLVLFAIVNVVTKLTNLTKNQETLIYMVKTLSK